MNLSIKPDLSGKIAVITGGAGVLCREFAKALALCGAKVAILNRTLFQGRGRCSRNRRNWRHRHRRRR